MARFTGKSAEQLVHFWQAYGNLKKLQDQQENPFRPRFEDSLDEGAKGQLQRMEAVLNGMHVEAIGNQALPDDFVIDIPELEEADLDSFFKKATQAVYKTGYNRDIRISEKERTPELQALLFTTSFLDRQQGTQPDQADLAKSLDMTLYVGRFQRAVQSEKMMSAVAKRNSNYEHRNDHGFVPDNSWGTDPDLALGIEAAEWPGLVSNLEMAADQRYLFEGGPTLFAEYLMDPEAFQAKVPEGQTTAQFLTEQMDAFGKKADAELARINRNDGFTFMRNQLIDSFILNQRSIVPWDGAAPLTPRKYHKDVAMDSFDGRDFEELKDKVLRNMLQYGKKFSRVVIPSFRGESQRYQDQLTKTYEDIKKAENEDELEQPLRALAEIGRAYEDSITRFAFHTRNNPNGPMQEEADPEAFRQMMLNSKREQVTHGSSASNSKYYVDFKNELTEKEIDDFRYSEAFTHDFGNPEVNRQLSEVHDMQGGLQNLLNQWIPEYRRNVANNKIVPHLEEEHEIRYCQSIGQMGRLMTDYNFASSDEKNRLPDLHEELKTISLFDANLRRLQEVREAKNEAETQRCIDYYNQNYNAYKKTIGQVETITGKWLTDHRSDELPEESFSVARRTLNQVRERQALLERGAWIPEKQRYELKNSMETNGYLTHCMHRMIREVEGWRNHKGTTKIGINSSEARKMFNALYDLHDTLTGPLGKTSLELLQQQVEALKDAAAEYHDAKKKQLEADHKERQTKASGRARYRLSEEIYDAMSVMDRQLQEFIVQAAAEEERKKALNPQVAPNQVAPNQSNPNQVNPNQPVPNQVDPNPQNLQNPAVQNPDPAQQNQEMQPPQGPDPQKQDLQPEQKKGSEKKQLTMQELQRKLESRMGRLHPEHVRQQEAGINGPKKDEAHINDPGHRMGGK